MKLKAELVDAIDARLVASRRDGPRVSRTRLTEIALARVLELSDDEFALALSAPKGT